MLKKVSALVILSIVTAAISSISSADVNHVCDAVYAQAHADYVSQVQQAEDAMSAASGKNVADMQVATAAIQQQYDAAIAAAKAVYASEIAAGQGGSDNSANTLNAAVNKKNAAFDAAEAAAKAQMNAETNAYADAAAAINAQWYQGVAAAKAQYDQTTQACYHP